MVAAGVATDGSAPDCRTDAQESDVAPTNASVTITSRPGGTRQVIDSGTTDLPRSSPAIGASAAGVTSTTTRRPSGSACDATADNRAASMVM